MVQYPPCFATGRQEPIYGLNDFGLAPHVGWRNVAFEKIFQDNSLQDTLCYNKHYGQTYGYNGSGTPSAANVVVTHILEWAGGGSLFRINIRYL